MKTPPPVNRTQMCPSNKDAPEATLPASARVSAEPTPAQYPPFIPHEQIDVETLRALLDGPQKKTRDQVRQILSSPEMALPAPSNREEERKMVLEWCQVLAREGLGGKLFPECYGGSDELGGFLAGFEMLAFHNLSLTIKFGVQYGLFGGSVLHLGTAYHHENILPQCISLDLPGCFAMTEIGHGSNVRQIETTATYNHEKCAFTIHSPSWSAGKIYIGNSARDGELATVFAQLSIHGENKGVHAFLVPIRDRKKALLPGVRIDDNGRKIGLNGVDNGIIWFDHVEVGKEALLDRFASIDAAGKWTSPIEDDTKRFFTMLGTLVGGRMSIAGTAVKGTQKALYIATKYAHRRRQFGKEGAPETPIIHYPTHQKRLGEGIATTTALSFTIQALSALHTKNEGKTTREVETRAAALKAYATWECMRILQQCREACGGEGYLWENQIGEILADINIFTTFEGDNTVLMQLVSRSLFSKLKERFSTGEITPSKVVVQKLRGQLRKFHLPGQRVNWHDLEVIGELLLARESALTLNLAQVMRKQRKQGMRSHDLMLEHQLDLLDLGKAYAERLTYQSMTAKYLETRDTHKDEKILSLMKTLTISFGLERILRAPSWYFTQHHLTAESHHYAHLTLRDTYREIAAHSFSLVEAYGIPEACLTAPIALD